MRKNVFYGILAASLMIGTSSSAKAAAVEPECIPTGFWIWRQVTCTYDHPEGAIVIKTDYKGNVTSVERMPY